MEITSKKGGQAVLVFAVLFLFFLQLITDFIAGIYAMALTGPIVGIPMEIALIVFFLSPFLLLLFKRGLPTIVLIVLGELVLLSRAAEIMLPTWHQMLIAGIGTSLFLFLFPALIWHYGQKQNSRIGVVMAAGLLLAVAASIVLRSMGATLDLSSVGWFRAIAWLLALAAAVALPGVFSQDDPENELIEAAPGKAGWGKGIGLCFGISSIFTLLYFAFGSPAVISRWTETSYIFVLAVAAGALVLFSWLLATVGRSKGLVRPGIVLLITAGFALFLTLTLAANQAALPEEAASFPFPDPEVSNIWIVTLLGLLVLYPILFLDFGLLLEEAVFSRFAMRKLGLGFGLASLFMLFMILANVFTSAWAYIDPALEPLFRNRFWHIHMIVAVILTLSILLVSKNTYEARLATIDPKKSRTVAGLVTVLCAVAIVAVILLEPNPQEPDRASGLTVAGYNIQQGYDVSGQRAHQAQCDLLKEIDADVIALSENETARIAGGNFDIVRYLASCLDMTSYVGPKTATSTFGYALLSKYAIENPETFHLFSGPGMASSDDPERVSGGDQVAVIKGQIKAGNQNYNIFVVHFDSNPPEEQPVGLVELVDGVDNVVAIGDYNCNPGTKCFGIISQELEHCTEQTGEPDLTIGDIDHVFVSPGLQCAGYRYVQNEASDHPVVVAEFE
jgi:endonuclease/exonuclease/phosphatase family metal-dependent hydrolase